MNDSPENAANPVEFNLDIRFYTDDVNYLFLGGHRNRDTAYIPRYSVVVKHLHGIYSEMLSDNPFAENILIELDVRLGQLAQLAEARIDACQASAREAEEEEGIVIRPFTRRQPYLYRNVMTYDEYGRYLLRTYGRTDRCIRWIRTLNGASRIPSRRAEDWIRELLKRHRGLNEVIIYYAKRMRHVTRSEVREGNQKALDLARALGRQVAPDVLDGTRRCQYYRVGRLGASGIGRRPPQEETPETAPRQASGEKVPLRRSEGAQH